MTKRQNMKNINIAIKQWEDIVAHDGEYQDKTCPFCGIYFGCFSCPIHNYMTEVEGLYLGCCSGFWHRWLANPSAPTAQGVVEYLKRVKTYIFTTN